MNSVKYCSFTLIRAYFPHRGDRKNSTCSGFSIPFFSCSAGQFRTFTNLRIIILLVFTQWRQAFVFTAVKKRLRVIPTPNWVPSRKACFCKDCIYTAYNLLPAASHTDLQSIEEECRSHLKETVIKGEGSSLYKSSIYKQKSSTVTYTGVI